MSIIDCNSIFGGQTLRANNDCFANFSTFSSVLSSNVSIYPWNMEINVTLSLRLERMPYRIACNIPSNLGHGDRR